MNDRAFTITAWGADGKSAVDLMGPISADCLRDDTWDGPDSLEPTLANIGREVCRVFQISKNNLLSTRRNRDFVIARHAAFWLARELTPKTVGTIGAYYNRDHTTVLHGISRASVWPEYYPDYANRLAEIRSLFTTMPYEDWPDET